MLSREEALEWAHQVLNPLRPWLIRQGNTSGYNLAHGLVADALLAAQAEARSRFLGAPLTPEQLAHVRQRGEGLASASWLAEGGVVTDSQSREVADVTGCPDRALWRALAEFIAHARQDVPALLSHVDYLESVLADLREDGSLDPYLAGRKAGRAEGKAECLRALEAHRNSLRAEADDAEAFLRAGLPGRAEVVHAALTQLALDVLDGSEEPAPQEAAP